MNRIRFRTLALSADDAFIISRLTLHKGRKIRKHSHDFAEIHWVDQGKALHWVNGKSMPMGPNHLLMIRPSDEHAFQCGLDHDFVFVVLAFPAEILRHIRERYFAASSLFYGGTQPQPEMIELDGSLIERLNEQADILANAPRNLFHLERFLLNMLFMIDSHSLPMVPVVCPNWLRRAYGLIQHPQALSGGLKAFRQLCGKSDAHISKACKKWLNATPSQIINKFRMDYAAKELAMSNRAIVDISLECGFDSLSHFYHLFKQQHGITPKEYRYRNKIIAGAVEFPS